MPPLEPTGARSLEATEDLADTPDPTVTTPAPSVTAEPSPEPTAPSATPSPSPTEECDWVLGLNGELICFPWVSH